MASGPREVRRDRRPLKVALLCLLLVAAALLSMVAGAYVALARALPSLELGERIASPQTTKIYDASPTPVLLAELRGLENRDVLSADQIPQVIRDAIVAVEDARFYVHKGVDFAAILRATWASLWHQEVAQGGSTITQHLVKDAFITDQETPERQVRAATLAYRLESRWSKEKILNEYLNVIYFGSGAYGIQAAAQSYFGVDAKDLTVAQAALLAGVPEAPSVYSPRRDPEAALTRRDLVLNRMYQQRYISSEQLQTALAADLQLAATGAMVGVKASHWVELVREQLVARYGSSLVLGGGLRVYTSLDLGIQQAADEAVGAAFHRPGDPAAALVAIDVHTGRIVAMVGGSDFSKIQFNLATQGEWRPGSALNPVVLATALAKGISPEATYAVGSAAEGGLTLAKAMANSSNGAFDRLVIEVGPDSVAKTATDMGMGDVTKGVSPLEMARAYATLADGGERLSAQLVFDPSKEGFPLSIVKVTDADGRVIDVNGTIRTRVMDPGIAALVTTCLRGVMTDGIGRAADIGRPAAGTIGVTEDGRDAWFVGYTPDLVAAVWVGHPGEQVAANDVPGAAATGGTLPAEIWAQFMRSALAAIPSSDFSTSSVGRWVTVDVCSESLLLPTDLCPTVVKRLFRSDKVPSDTCNIHVPKAVFMPNVVGMSLTKAKRLLTAANLRVKTVKDGASLQPAGTVVKQSHSAGKPILHGSEVVLRVSSGEATAVPALVDLPLDQAQVLVAGAHLSAAITLRPADAPAGSVLSQDPAARTVVPKGSTVRLIVSSGPETPPSTQP